MIAVIRNGVAVTAMVLMVGTALGQYEKNQPEKQKKDKQPEATRSTSGEQEWHQVIQQMEGDGISLKDAISKAVKEVGGNAISARVVTADMSPREARRAEPEKASHYRIEVLCRTDDGNFKVVTLDGRTGEVTGTTSTLASTYLSSSAQPGRTAFAEERRMGGDVAQRTFRLMKCSELEDTKVKNSDGADLGHITDFAIEPRTGRVSYAAVSFGGWLEMGDKLFAVPLGALEVMSTDRILLDVDKKEMENAKGFDDDKWPTHADPRWAGESRTRTGEAEEPMAGKERQKPEAGRGGSEYISSIERASKLIGRDVKNRQGEELGEIEDLYIDPNQERVCIAVLSHGGVLGARDKLFAIPWQAFEMTGDEDTLILDISKDRLKTAPNASKAERDTWDNPDWVLTVYEFYRIDPYWKGEFGTRGGYRD